MQQTHAKRKVGGKHNRKFERRSRNRQPHTAASSFRLCGFHRKNHKKTIPAHKIWISSIAQSMFCKLWSSPLAQVSESGASLTCWKDTETTIRGLMLIANKEAQCKRHIQRQPPRYSAPQKQQKDARYRQYLASSSCYIEETSTLPQSSMSG